MSPPRTAAALVTLAALLAAALLLFEVGARQLTGAWFTFGVHPEVLRQLELSLADQKRLAGLDPAGAARYHRRFAAIESLLGRLRILEYNRDEVVGRYQAALLIVFGALAAAAAGVYLAGKVRQQARLDRLRGALARLSAGEVDVEVGERRRDLIGRVGAMVEETSRAMARDRRRLASLENLAAWQEAARRQAHEMRTPLTAARLDLGRLHGLLGEDGGGDGGDGGRRRESLQLADSVLEELDRLGRFTQAFTSFARLPRPRLCRDDLGAFVAEFAATFGSAWPNLVLVAAAAPAAAPGRAPGPPLPAAPGPGPPRPAAAPLAAHRGPPRLSFDRDLLRQVLVNLCDNSSQALAAASGGEAAANGGAAAANGGAAVRGTVTFTLIPDGRPGRGGAAGRQDRTSSSVVALEVADDGPGIPAAVLPRLFEPYATTRRVGEGMGLGLAISRKILLDHGGDLELARTSAAGSVFRLLLPCDREAW
ncbi:MAG TPA: ATP-binding protein [Thermoanaerobaculia bacterium]|nr:ATP-binding protein [Thermoanaerobaculia bacterium]